MDTLSAQAMIAKRAGAKARTSIASRPCFLLIADFAIRWPNGSTMVDASSSVIPKLATALVDAGSPIFNGLTTAYST